MNEWGRDDHPFTSVLAATTVMMLFHRLLMIMIAMLSICCRDTNWVYGFNWNNGLRCEWLIYLICIQIGIVLVLYGKFEFKFKFKCSTKRYIITIKTTTHNNNNNNIINKFGFIKLIQSILNGCIHITRLDIIWNGVMVNHNVGFHVLFDARGSNMYFLASQIMYQHGYSIVIENLFSFVLITLVLLPPCCFTWLSNFVFWCIIGKGETKVKIKDR